MASSQKHRSLRLVPWFNTEEFKHVFKCVYSVDKTEQSKALEILKIWKIRTPILSAGIEGTLIILDSLLLDNEDVPEDRLQHLYSVSLVRFLNLSAAHNEKQGTFYKTAVKNDLPKWLISLRHDIAHSHKLPSKSMLEMGLKFGLDWLKQKYWEPQILSIEDYCVKEQTESDLLEKTLKAYVSLTISVYKKTDLSIEKSGFLQEVTDMIYKKFHRNRVEVVEMVDILEEMLKSSLETDRNKNVGKLIADFLVNEDFLLYGEFEINENGEEKINKNFRDIWTNLLNILQDNKLLFCVISRLFDATGDISISEAGRKMASFWLCEIFFSLFILKLIKEHIDSIISQNGSNIDVEKAKMAIKSQLRSQPEFEEYLDLDSINNIYFEEIKKFESKVLHLANKYTLNFLEIVFKFNGHTENFVREFVNIISNKVSVKNTNVPDFEEKIHTLKELTVNVSLNNEEITEDNEMDVETVCDANNYNLNVNYNVGSQWNVIKDTSAFNGCPLGVLPHQNRNESPLIKGF